MASKKLWLLYIAVFLLSLEACYEEVLIENNAIETQDKKINDWMYKTMATYYYWADELPDAPDYSLSPEDFFSSLKFSKDKFSWILNDKETNLNGLNGVKKNYGIEYALGYADSTQTNLLGIVLCVYAGTGADTSGIKRGDIFYEINNTIINRDNYEELLSLEKATFTFRRQLNLQTSFFVQELKAETIKINPIPIDTVYTIEDKKIGYICYNQFISDNGDDSEKYKHELLNCFEKFKQVNINELVIDFRYNSGGLINLSVLFSSLIIPSVDTTQIALKFSYNKKIQDLYDKYGTSTNLKFVDYPNSYIGGNLKRVFIITGASTASSSEAMINSLLPYMEVILVGMKTYGKNYGSMMFIDSYNSENPWVLQPITFKILNAQNKSDYDDGFNPNYPISEFSYPLVELGNLEEPLLKFTTLIILGKMNPFLKYSSIDGTRNSIFPIKYSTDNYLSLPMIDNVSFNKGN